MTTPLSGADVVNDAVILSVPGVGTVMSSIPPDRRTVFIDSRRRQLSE